MFGRCWQDGNSLFPLQLPLGGDRVGLDAGDKPLQPFQLLLSWESPRAHIVLGCSSPIIALFDPIRVSLQKCTHSWHIFAAVISPCRARSLAPAVLLLWQKGPACHTAPCSTGSQQALLAFLACSRHTLSAPGCHIPTKGSKISRRKDRDALNPAGSCLPAFPQPPERC